VRVVAPRPLMREAAAILEPIQSKAVVVGALAVQIALDGHDVLPSELPHERGFTWVKGDVKVQLMAPFDPIARRRPPAKGIPVNHLVSELSEHRLQVAFEDRPTRPLLLGDPGRARRPQGRGLRARTSRWPEGGERLQ
jgi:hypothetical protein